MLQISEKSEVKYLAIVFISFRNHVWIKRKLKLYMFIKESVKKKKYLNYISSFYRNRNLIFPILKKRQNNL